MNIFLKSLLLGEWQIGPLGITTSHILRYNTGNLPLKSKQTLHICTLNVNLEFISFYFKGII
jgi:hypothetical protein